MVIRSPLNRVLFFPIALLLALSGLLSESAFPQSSPAHGKIIIFKGSLAEAVQSAHAVVLATPITRRPLSSAIDKPGHITFEIQDILKGTVDNKIDILMPGQTMAFRPVPGKSYLLFIAGRAGNVHALMNHSLEVPLAFEMKVGALTDSKLPRGWENFSLSDVKILIQTAGHQSD
ncbi:hypothetical protein [Emcibacter sp.]|uniref:hypothetical protein n=1 Tax=Emcibacter sp. TaxID=1979954 RepID=UPI003A8D84EE